MRIPFSNYNIKIIKRSITVVDNKTGIPLTIESWLNRFSLSKKTPILENIYDTIASEFSKTELILSKDECIVTIDGTEKHTYTQLKNHPSYDVLTLRPNPLQTISDLLYTIAYQLHMYRNALVLIVRDGDIVTSLEPINCADYLFGQGYEISGECYLKLKSKKTGNIVLLNYNDVIHLRLNPNDIFYGDCNEKFDLTNFVKLFDENLSVMLNELKDAGNVRGIIEVGASVGGFGETLLQQSDKISKQKEVSDRIRATKDGIIVLDSGEKWHSLSSTMKTMSPEDVNNFMKYLYNFKGINQAVIDGTANEAQMRVFFNKTIMPIIKRLAEELNYKFLTPEARKEGCIVEIFRNPFEYTATNDLLEKLYLGAMFFTKNEARRMGFKLRPLPGGDDLISNKNFVDSVKNIKDGGDKANVGEDS